MAHKGEHKQPTVRVATQCCYAVFYSHQPECKKPLRILPHFHLERVYNTLSPHDGRNGNSDGRATEVRKPEEKGRVFDALIPPVIHPACNTPCNTRLPMQCFCKFQLLLCFLCIFARNMSKNNTCYFSFPAKCAKIGIRELPVVQFRRQDTALEGRFSIMVCVKGIVY